MPSSIYHTWAYFPRPTSPSVVSASSDSSRSTHTIWGPGALSGKALLAFGRASIRGVEDLMLRGKLVQYKRCFPHIDSKVFKSVDVDAMYDDILELSRPDIYSDGIRSRAWHLIMMQIARRQTYHLRRSLMKWPQVEIRLFLDGLFDNLRIFWQVPKWYSAVHRNRVSRHSSISYFSTQYPNELHAALPLMEFLHMLGGSDYDTTLTLLDAGILEVFMRIRICDSHSFYRLGEYNEDSRSSLQAAYSSVMCNLTRHHGALVLSHPICALWPDAKSAPTDEDMAVYAARRHLAWRQLSHDLVQRRLMAVNDFLQDPSKYATTDQVDVCVDFIEFLRSTYYGRDIQQLAASYLRKCMTLGGKIEHILLNIFVTHPVSLVVGAFKICIRMFLKLEKPRPAPSPGSPDDLLLLRRPSVLGRSDIDRLLSFIGLVARTNNSFRQALIHGGILVLLLAIIDIDVRGPEAPRPHALRTTRTPITELNDVALALLDEPGYLASSDMKAEKPSCSFAATSPLNHTIQAIFGDVSDVPLEVTYSATRFIFEKFFR